MKSAYVVMLLILALAGWGSWETHNRKVIAQNLVTVRNELTQSKKAVEDLETAARRTEAAAKTLRDALAKAKKEQDVAQQKLDKALKDNPKWSGTAVPDSVRSALEDRDPSTGQPTPEAPAPGLPNAS